VLKLSGEEVRIEAHWQYEALNTLDLLIDIQRRFASQWLSMKFAYAVLAEARFFGALPQVACQAELQRLLKRHRGNALDTEQGKAQAAELAPRLAALAYRLDIHRQEWDRHWKERHSHQTPTFVEEAEAPQIGAVELGRWLTLARFIASGGRDE
jgi:hypothetical protein